MTSILSRPLGVDGKSSNPSDHSASHWQLQCSVWRGGEWELSVTTHCKRGGMELPGTCSGSLEAEDRIYAGP